MAAVQQAQIDATQDRRAQAARLLAEASARAAASVPPAEPAVTEPAPPAEPEPAPSSAPAEPQPVSLPRLSLPPTGFSWPAAGLSVGVVPMPWTPGETVNPDLDANGFDPVAHWLVGTGETEEHQPVVLAAHTCYGADPLCNPATFPFNRLSFPGWEKGQSASISDANGQTIPCSLEDRRIVDKSTQFSFPNDPHHVVVFSCNLERPHDEITLVTFRCG
ncbi:hypothetical protein [Sinomonas mesophila]|uniref:hypothetical protein n=1 Tax=Sinomonas mesophila TaxID=1531955 RepID=UPI00111568FA|nr:hypothetical protein [Sinomonas mesophila]